MIGKGLQGFILTLLQNHKAVTMAAFATNIQTAALQFPAQIDLHKQNVSALIVLSGRTCKLHNWYTQAASHWQPEDSGCHWQPEPSRKAAAKLQQFNKALLKQLW